MSKRKRSEKIAAATTWSDFEQAFFEAAPPDEPEPAAEPLRFEDLGPPASGRRLPSHSLLAIVLAIVTVLIGLTAVVFAR